MIWMLITKEEMVGPFLVFKYNEEALGRENISLMVIDETDSLDFVSGDDVIISRTFNEKLLETIHNKGVRTTAEDISVYSLVSDKVKLSEFLKKNNILVPRVHSMSDIKDGNTYFVKPRYGSDSIGIDEDSICRTVEKVIWKQEHIGDDCIIEDFIDGVDCTSACFVGSQNHIYSIKVENQNNGGIQTQNSKEYFIEYCSPLNDDRLNEICNKVISLLGIRHHVRIDFRKGNDGNYYLIDINLLPGLGPTAHLAKCMLLTENISYIDVMKAVVNSAN